MHRNPEVEVLQHLADGGGAGRRIEQRPVVHEQRLELAGERGERLAHGCPGG